MKIKKKDVFTYHSAGSPGKIQAASTKPCSTQRSFDVEGIVRMVAICALDTREVGG